MNSKTNAVSAFEVLFCDGVIDFIDNMEISLKAKAYSLFDILEQKGNTLREPHSKALGNGLFELRVKGKDNIVRLFYCFGSGKKIYILHGFTKKSQKTPKSEIEKAMKIMKEVLK